jgi:hypothetical protein
VIDVADVDTDRSRSLRVRTEGREVRAPLALEEP